MSAQGEQGGKRRSGPKSRTSDFLGVTQYRRTGRWEAHVWDAAEGGSRKGRQLHLGSFPEAVPAAVAYDRAAVKLRGPQAALNFPQTDYQVDPFLKEHGHLSKEDFVYQLRVWAQSAALALEYGLPAPAAGVAHPVRTRKRASSPAAGREPAARRPRTLAPGDSGASNQDDDVICVGTSSSKDQRQQDQVRRSLRVRRGNPRPSYEERSESDLDEPSSDANGNNWPACSRGKHRPAAEAQPLETLAPPEPVNQQYQQREPEEDDKMSSWAAVGLRTQRFRQRFDPLRRMGNTSQLGRLAMASRSAPSLPTAAPARVADAATSPLKMHKRIFEEIDKCDELPRAKQGYLPSDAQATHTSDVPDACTYQNGKPGDDTPFSPGLVHIKSDKWEWVEWEASGTPSVDLHCVTACNTYAYRLAHAPGLQSTGASLLQCCPPAAPLAREPQRDSEVSPSSTFDIAEWPDLPPLPDSVTPRKTALGQLLVAGYPTSIEKPLGAACTAAAPPSSPGSQLDDMELSFLDSFLSPLKSCKSPRPSHVGRSPRFSPAQLLSPAQSTQSLSPAQGFNSLAHAFEQGYQIPLSPVDMAPKRRRY